MAVVIVLLAVSTVHQALHLGFPRMNDRALFAAYWPLYAAVLVAAPLVYFPAFWWMRERLSGTRPALLFPVAGIALTVVPVWYLHLQGNPHLTDLTSRDALVSCASLAASGLLLGAFYPALDREAAEERGE